MGNVIAAALQRNVGRAIGSVVAALDFVLPIAAAEQRAIEKHVPRDERENRAYFGRTGGLRRRQALVSLEGQDVVPLRYADGHCHQQTAD